MVSEEIGLNDALEAAGVRADRDRPRRIYHPAARRGAVPHHRAGRASDAATRSRPISAALTRTCRRTATYRRRTAADRGARASCASGSSPPTSASRAPISWSPRPAPRSSSPTRATATSRRSCPRCTSCWPRSRRSCRRCNDARAAAARAGPLGHRAGDVGLHHASRPARAGPTIRTGRRNTTSSSSTTAARPCSAASSRTCCAASAAAPA